MIRFPGKYQQTSWFQPWFPSGAVYGFRSHPHGLGWKKIQSAVLDRAALASLETASREASLPELHLPLLTDLWAPPACHAVPCSIGRLAAVGRSVSTQPSSKTWESEVVSTVRPAKKDPFQNPAPRQMTSWPPPIAARANKYSMYMGLGHTFFVFAHYRFIWFGQSIPKDMVHLGGTWGT